MRENFKEGEFLVGGEGLGLQGGGLSKKNWTLGEGQPLCKCAQLPH